MEISAADGALQTARLLIVDDQEANNAVLESVLEQGGYRRFRSTTDSRQVAALYAEFRPDLILLDLVMPAPDGFAVMEQLRPLIRPGEYLPILALTADVTPEVKRRALAGGAKDFLTKPLDVVEVLLRIKNLLETRFLYLQLQEQNRSLEDKVHERTAQLAESNDLLQRQFKRLAALHRIDATIAGSLDLRLTLATVLSQALTELQVDAACIWVLDPSLLILDYVAGQGWHRPASQPRSLSLGEGRAGQVALAGKLVAWSNLSQTPSSLPLPAGEGFQAYAAVPLTAKGQVKGVLEVFHRTPLAMGTEWLDFLAALGGQAAIAIDSTRLFEDLQRANVELTLAYDATIEGWSRAMDLRDKETEGHTQRVTEMTDRLARALGMRGAELVQVRRGALLHDIGKLGIPDAILLKPGQLTAEERALMRQHPQYAYDMLSPIAYLRQALDIPYCHHEKWDGTGFPRGLSGDQIPLAARLFAVADVWDALRSDRPYRPGWPEAKAREYVREQAGKHFDPRVVEAFLSLEG